MRSILIGCGVGAEHHFYTVKQLRNVEFAATCDIDLEKAKAAAAKWGIKHAYDNISDALSNERPDVVHIVSPPATHFSMALEAIENGCHILLEKPMTITMGEAEEIITVSKKRGVKLCMVHNHLYDPVILKGKKLIEAGKIGNVCHVDIIYGVSKKKRAKAVDKRKAWMQNLPLIEFSEYAPHSIYLMLSFLKDAKVVHAVMKNRGLGPDPHGLLNIQFANEDGSGNILIFKNLDYGRFSVRIYGTRAALNINVYELTMGKYTERNLPKTVSRSLASIEEGAMFLWSTVSNTAQILTGKLKRRPGHLKLIEGFYESIRNNEDPPVPGEHGKAGVKVLEDVFTCITQGL